MSTATPTTARDGSQQPAAWTAPPWAVEEDLLALPGGDLVVQGFKDLQAGIESIPSLLVEIGAPRLHLLGWSFPVRDSEELPEHRLYTLLESEQLEGAHSRYNAYIRRLVSFERAVCVLR